MKFNTGGQFERPEPGSWLGICFKLIDLGTQRIEWNGEEKFQRKVLICFELPDQKMKGEHNPELAGKPFSVLQTYTQSLHKSSRLKKDLEQWRGKEYTDEELKNFDPHKLLGQPALLNLVESKDGQYTNIGSISPVPKSMTIPKLVNAPCYFSLDMNEFDADVLNGFSDKLQEKIKGTPEFQMLTNTPAMDKHTDIPFNEQF